jgi:Na+/H+ antiporter NhaD/arsenite permease-like protein
MASAALMAEAGPGFGGVSPVLIWVVPVVGILLSMIYGKKDHLPRDPAVLQGPLENTLLAISARLVFMGTNTYTGNAPDFVLKSSAGPQGVRIPGFFGYMGRSVLFLIPIFAGVTLIFFA